MNTNRKEFVDAVIGEGDYEKRWQYLAAFFLAAISIFLSSLNFKAEAVGVSLLMMIALFIFLRNHWIFKVITDDKGLTFIHFSKKDFVRWNQVTSVGLSKHFLIGGITNKEVGEVKTKEQNYYFPLTMKEKGNIYPIYDGGISKRYWKDEFGCEFPINADNSPLYNEIKKYLEQRQFSGSITVKQI